MIRVLPDLYDQSHNLAAFRKIGRDRDGLASGAESIERVAGFLTRGCFTGSDEDERAAGLEEA